MKKNREWCFPYMESQNFSLIIKKIKLTLIFTMLVSLTFGNSYSQTKVTLHFEKATIQQVLETLEDQTGHVFLYKDEIFDPGKRYSVDFVEEPFEEVLKSVCATAGADYELRSERQIILTKKEKEAAVTRITQQQHTITGVVTDQNGQPLPGVTVIVKGTTTGTVTSSDGSFSLTIPQNAETLQFSFVGMQSQEIPIEGRGTFTVVMEEEAIDLEEVVAVGYGVKKKVNLTGAIAQVTEEVLKDRPITNIGQGLQGVVPNLQVTFPDGDPKSSPSFNIRGTTTISGEAGNPLILVDGIQMNMNMLNPNDIESISVLKDAASAAIYGARGAFGVILVTTKKGLKNREPRISYSGSLQLNTHTYLPDVFNGLDYMKAANEAQFNRNKTYRYSEEQLRWTEEYLKDPINNPVYHEMANGKIFWHRGENSYKEMIQDWAPTHKHSFNVTGGAKRFNYFASVGYMNQEGLFKDVTDVFKRYNMMLNLEMNVTDWLNIGFKSNYNRTWHDEPHRFTGKGTSWWEQMTRGEPQILYPVVTPDYSPVGAGVPTEHFYNFLNSGSRNVTHVETAIYSINAEAKIYRGLSLKGDFNYRTFNSKNKDFIKTFGFIRDTWQLQYNHTSPSYAYKESAHEDYFSTNIYGDYLLSVDNSHNFHVLLGYNQEWNLYENFSAQRENLISGDVPVIKLGVGNDYTNDSESDWAIRGIFLRFNYDYKGKYLFEMNGRYDGTSKFPKKSRFAFFPSISVGWRIMEEPFMENLRTTIDNFKIRASYGSLGNQNVSGNYPYISNFGVNQNVAYIIDGQRPIGLIPPGIVSADLTWESTTTLNFGFDATIFGNLDFSLDWYKRGTTNMLTAGDKLPSVLGTSVPRRNNADLETKGWELSTVWRDKLDNGLQYDLGVVLSDYQAVITKFDANPNKIYTSYYVGQKIGEIWGYETVGLFQSTEEVSNSPNQNQLGNAGKWGPGDVRYANLNDDDVINWGDRTVDNPGDTKIIGNSTPRYQYGITGNIKYKRIDFNVFFQGIGKRDFMPVGNYFWGHNAVAVATANYDIWNNSWREDNRDAYFPIYKGGSSYNRLTQTRFLQSGAYVRLKNITVGYTLPSLLLSKMKISNLRMYLAGYNLWEYTPLRGNFDPEQVENLGQHYPMQRSYLFGIEVTF